MELVHDDKNLGMFISREVGSHKCNSQQTELADEDLWSRDARFPNTPGRNVR